MKGTTVPGEVRNVSAGGLGVVADAPAIEQGERLDVVVRVPGASPFTVHALVWHVRAARRTADGKSTRSWGLVLGEACPEFARLVQKLTGPRRPPAVARLASLRRPAATPAPDPARASESPTSPADPAPATASATPPADPARAVGAPPSPLPPAPQQFAIRIQQVGKPRTCQVVASGATQEDAVKAALAEIGAGWTVLDVRAVA